MVEEKFEITVVFQGRFVVHAGRAQVLKLVLSNTLVQGREEVYDYVVTLLDLLEAIPLSMGFMLACSLKELNLPLTEIDD